MVDDPAKEIESFFKLVERQHEVAQRYITLVAKAYQSYDEDVVARLISKKQQRLHKNVKDMLQLGKDLIQKADELDAKSRRPIAARDIMQDNREQLRPFILAAMQKDAASVHDVSLWKQGSFTGIEVTVSTGLAMHGGLISLDAILGVAKKAESVIFKTAKHVFGASRRVSGVEVDINVTNGNLVFLVSLKDEATEADAALLKKNLRL